MSNASFASMLSGDLVAPEDIRYRFKFLHGTDTVAPWVKLKDIVFSNKEYVDLAEEIIAKFERPVSDEEKKRITRMVSKIARIFGTGDNLAYQVVDSIDNAELYTEDDIVEIFIRANSGGTPLGKSDLLFSLLTASWDDADQEMEALLEELNRTGYRFNRDFILKSCLSIFGKGASYNVDKFRHKDTKENIVSNWGKIAGAIKDVKDFVYGKTFIKTDATLPSYLGLIPLIYFRYHYPGKWKTATGFSDYLLRTLLAGAFSGSPDNLIDKCTKKIDELKDFNVNEIYGVIRADGRNLEITRGSVLGQSYGSKEIHILFNLWYNFNYQPSFPNNKPQVDHIFPQSLLKKIKDVNPDTGKRDLLRYKQDQRDQIANCMLLTARENGTGEKWDTAPEVWFADKDDAYLNLHLIPKNRELWKIENFEQFIEARKKLIEEKFEFLILKEQRAALEVAVQ